MLDFSSRWMPHNRKWIKWKSKPYEYAGKYVAQRKVRNKFEEQRETVNELWKKEQTIWSACVTEEVGN